MGARRAAACLCTARVLREVVAAGTWRAPECAGGPLWDPGGHLWRGPGGDLEGEPTLESSMVGWCSCCDPVYGTTLSVLCADQL